MSEAPALKRGLSILAYLRDNPDADSNELSSRLNIPPASLSRLTETLVNEDFLRVRCNGGWSIGNALRYVAFSTYDRDPVTIQVLPILESLSRRWRATFVCYEFIDERRILWRVKSEPKNGISTQSCGFVTHDLHCNAQGNVFLSTMSDEEIRNYVSGNDLRRITPETLTDVDSLLSRVQYVRENGYCYQKNENHKSMQQVAVPLEITNEPAILCIGCYLPLQFTNMEAIIEDILTEALTLNVVI